MEIALWGSEVALDTTLDIGADETLLVVRETLWDYSCSLELLVPYDFYFFSGAVLYGAIWITHYRNSYRVPWARAL